MKRNLIIVLLIAILVLSTFLTGCNMARNGNLNNDINDIEDLSLIHIWKQNMLFVNIWMKRRELRWKEIKS